MDGQENIFTQSRVRHLRFLFFIEAGTSFQVLAKLIIDNYRLWGGAYNPFVPVDGDSIRENYKGVLGSCDPDYIFYSKGIDLEKLKSQCPQFHPKGFVELDEHGRNNFDGVYSGYMLAPELLTDMWFERRNTLLNFSNGLEHDTLSFYELSFGFGPRFVEDNAAGGGLNVIEVGEQKFADLNKIIHENKPVFSRLLSAKYHVGTLIAPNNDWEVNSFELVLYDEDTNFEELIYFWNRKLFQRHDNKIRQLIASRKQVMELIEDTYFETLLYEFLFGEKLYLRSVGIDSQGLNEIAIKMQKKFRRVQVHVRTTAEFPYKVMRYRFVSENDYPFDKAPVNGKSQYLILSQPLFKHSFPSFRGKFVCDVMIIKEGQTRTDSIRFPFFTPMHHLVTKHACRINMLHNLSLIVDQKDRGIDIRVPEDIEIIRARLSDRDEFGAHISVMNQPRISPAGLKLAAFIEMLANEWFYIEQLIGDPFWLKLIMGMSNFKKHEKAELVRKIDGVPTRFHKELVASNIGGINNVLSHKDIENELRRYYYLHIDEIKNGFAVHDYHPDDDSLVELMEKSIGEDLNIHINPTLQSLVEMGALFIGMKVKCYNCGSNSWYALTELHAKMDCRGCFKSIIPSVTAHIYYKFNEILVNNLKVRSDNKSFDGNYVVLKTLLHLRDSSRMQPSNFSFAPCVDILVETPKGGLNTDADLLAIVDGKLIIGEAKPSVDDFGTGVINNLIELGNLIKPDRLILAYAYGVNIQAKIDKVKAGVTVKSCEIIGYQISEPWHQFGRIYGCR